MCFLPKNISDFFKYLQDLYKKSQQSEEAKNQFLQGIDQFIQRYVGLVYNIVRKYINNDFDTDEVVQNVWIILFVKNAFLKVYGEGEGARRWLQVVAQNEALTYLKRDCRLKTLITTGICDVNSEFSDNEDTVEDEEPREIIRKALGVLPNMEKEIIYLYYIKGMKAIEVAKKLKLSSVESVHTRLSMARKKLRNNRRLKEYING